MQVYSICRVREICDLHFSLAPELGKFGRVPRQRVRKKTHEESARARASRFSRSCALYNYHRPGARGQKPRAHAHTRSSVLSELDLFVEFHFSQDFENVTRRVLPHTGFARIANKAV